MAEAEGHDVAVNLPLLFEGLGQGGQVVDCDCRLGHAQDAVHLGDSKLGSERCHFGECELLGCNVAQGDIVH